VISISGLGPSFKKADYSNYGIEQTDFSAPGGFFRDYFGSDQYMQPENMNLSPMPEALALAALENPANAPFILRDCRGSTCGYYQYIQGTSMAAPHATGVAALIVSTHGRRDPVHGGLTMSPGAVERVLTRTARQTPCPFPPIATYPDRAPDLTYTATCEGTLARNGFYGRGIVNALTAVLD
jgi:subtilisin family serine protease